MNPCWLLIRCKHVKLIRYSTLGSLETILCFSVGRVLTLTHLGTFPPFQKALKILVLVYFGQCMEASWGRLRCIALSRRLGPEPTVCLKFSLLTSRRKIYALTGTALILLSAVIWRSLKSGKKDKKTRCHLGTDPEEEQSDFSMWCPYLTTGCCRRADQMSWPTNPFILRNIFCDWSPKSPTVSSKI